MDNFPLFSIPAANREKVLTKLEQTNYFRMQQTCKDMHEFIRTSQNVTVPVKKGIRLESDGYRYRSWKENFLINLEDLYGTRIDSFDVCDNSKEFDVLCNELRSNRVQCDRLSMGSEEYFNKEQCQQLLNILKPNYVSFKSEKSDRYEALFQAKSLKSVTISLNEVAALGTLPRLLPAYEDVEIKIEDVKEPQFPVLEILKILDSQPFPNLQQFRCDIRGDWELPSFMELWNTWTCFKWQLIGEDDGYGVSYVGERTYPNGAICEVTFSELINQTSAYIRYKLKPTKY